MCARSDPALGDDRRGAVGAEEAATAGHAASSTRTRRQRDRERPSIGARRVRRLGGRDGAHLHHQAEHVGLREALDRAVAVEVQDRDAGQPAIGSARSRQHDGVVVELEVAVEVTAFQLSWAAARRFWGVVMVPPGREAPPGRCSRRRRERINTGSDAVWVLRPGGYHEGVERASGPDETCAVPGEERRRTSRSRSRLEDSCRSWPRPSRRRAASSWCRLPARCACSPGSPPRNSGCWPRSRLYLVLNLGGSLVLALLALLDRQLGFLLLEGAWALVSASSLLAIAGNAERRRPRVTGSCTPSWAIQDSNLGPLPYQRSALTD